MMHRSLSVLFLVTACGHAPAHVTAEPEARTLLEVRGTLVGQPNEHYSECNTTAHGMGGSADASHAFTLEERSAVVIEADADFPTPVLAVVGSDGGEVACAQGTLARTLPPGEYRVVVESAPAELGGDAVLGPYALTARATPVPERESVCAVAEPLGHETRFSLDGASVFDVGPGPERVFSLHLDEARRIRLNTADGELIVLASCADDAVLRRSNEDHHFETSLATVLPAGDYFVLLEGGRDASGTLTYDSFEEEPGQGACTEAPLLDLSGGGATVEVETFTAVDRGALVCGSLGSLDTHRRIHVTETSELEISAFSIGHRSVVAVSTDCRGTSPIACFAAPDRQPMLLEPGDYFVSVEGAAPNEVGVTELHLRLSDRTQAALACTRASRIALGEATTVVADPALDDLTGDDTTGAVYTLEVREGARFRFGAEGEGRDPLFGVEVRSACVDPRTSVFGASSQGRPTFGDEAVLAAGTYYVHVWMAERAGLRPDRVTFHVEDVAPPLEVP